MKQQISRYLTIYFNSSLWPLVVFLACATGMVLSGLLYLFFGIPLLHDVFTILTGLALLGILAVIVWNLIQKRWRKSLLNTLSLVFCVAAGGFGLVFLAFFSLFGPSEDGFADHLTIPSGLAVQTPLPRLDRKPGETDPFQSALLSALETPGSTDPTVTAEISALAALHKNHRALLERYLATHPAWRVYERDGHRFATRRCMVGPEWSSSLHGYYSKYDLGPFTALPKFETRTTIGLDGEPWFKRGTDATALSPGTTAPVEVSWGSDVYSSRAVISDGSILLSLYEESVAEERRMTKAALEFLQNEFQALLDNPTWEHARTLLPPDSIITGPARFSIRDSSQGGIYDSSIWINPGEPGRIYLKAFEVTKGTRLSADRLEERSTEWVGWSDDPDEKFFSNTHFSIYEGDWGQFYAARMEVWFDPDSGGPERKLLEENFKIQGWQR